MIIRLTENINSVCGEYEAAKGEEMRVIKYYDDLAIYYCVSKVNFDPGIVYEACKECAEVVEDKKPEQEKCEFVSYNNEKNTIKLSCPLDDMEPLKEWKIETRLAEKKPEQKPPSKYHRANTIKDKEFVDFYDIINLLQSNGEPIPPEIQHALKKLMYNDRGHKNMFQDKKEASWSIDRWFENNEL